MCRPWCVGDARAWASLVGQGVLVTCMPQSAPIASRSTCIPCTPGGPWAWSVQMASSRRAAAMWGATWTSLSSHSGGGWRFDAHAWAQPWGTRKEKPPCSALTEGQTQPFACLKLLKVIPKPWVFPCAISAWTHITNPMRACAQVAHAAPGAAPRHPRACLLHDPRRLSYICAQAQPALLRHDGLLRLQPG